MIRRRGTIPLWALGLLAIVSIGALAWWTWRQTSNVTPDGRETVVFWGNIAHIGEELYTLAHEFERKNPEYRVVLSTGASRDYTTDAQRLMCAIAGGVPPDVVWFDRFAIGEWAARGAFTDLRPMIEAQRHDDPHRIDLADYYAFTVEEASYKPPGAAGQAGIYGMPMAVDVRALFVNCDALRQAGLVDANGDPKPPRTWEELRAYATKLTVYRRPGEPRSGIARLGFAPNQGNSWLYLYAWQAGGEFMNADRTRVTLSAPPNVRALQFMSDVYDDLGGYPSCKAFQEAHTGGAIDPFLTGALAMKIDGDAFVMTIADYRRSMDFMVVPPPMPADELAKGRRPLTWSGGFAYVIPSTSRQKAGAFKFIQYLLSEEGVRLLERGRREQRESGGRLYLPMPLANRRLYEDLLDEAIEDNADLPETFRRAYVTFRELLPNTRIRPVTPVGLLLWTQHVSAFEAGVLHGYREQARRTGRSEAELALEAAQAPVQRALDRILDPPPAKAIDWRPLFWAYAIVVVAPFAAMYLAYRRGRRFRLYRGREVATAMMFASPWIVGFVALVGGPILFSIVFSFAQYDVLSPARAVGATNYRELLADPLFYKSLANTLFMTIQIPLGMAVSLGIALLLNRGIRFIGLYRAGFYLPVVMPLVASSLMWIWLLNPNRGLLNDALAWLYGTPVVEAIERLISLFTDEPFRFGLPAWLQDPRWSKPSLILMNLWKAGGAMLIWLAGLQSIPNELYEAASIDGAGRWRRFTSVTLPMLSPFVLFNLIIGLIGTMQMFGEAYIMTTPPGAPLGSTLFYALYLFQQAFGYFRMGYASALAWILFVVVLALTLAQLWLGKRWVHYEQA